VDARRRELLCWLLPALCALIWCWPAYGMGFLSDDYLAVYYLDRDTGAVHWHRVLAEFARPWFGVRDLYRPMVSLSIAGNLALGGMRPLGFHVLNVLLVAVTASAVTILARQLLPARRWPAVLAGMFCMLHPATVEPACWIAARNSGLEVCCHTLALASFALFLRGNLRSRALAWMFLLLGLLTKEGAATVPLGFAVLDLWVQWARPWRQRLALHAPTLVIVGLYFLWRRWLLGTFTTLDTSGTPLGMLLGTPLHLRELLLPPATPAVLLGSAWGVLLSVALLRAPARVLLLAAWAVMVLLPSGHIHSQGAAFDGRLLLAAVPILGLAVASAVDGSARGRGWLVLVPTVGALLCLGVAANRWQQRYQEANAAVAKIQRELTTAATGTAPGRPLAIAACTLGGPVVTLHSGIAGLPWLRPFAPEDLAVVGLTNVLTREAHAAELYFDASPLRAVADAGGPVVLWDTQQGALETAAPASEPPGLAQEGQRPQRFTAAQPFVATAAAVVHVELATMAHACSLRIDDDLPGLPFGTDTATIDRRDFWFDLTGCLALFVRARQGLLLRTVLVEVDGQAPPAGTRVWLHRRPAELDQPALLHGRVLSLEQLPRLLVPPRPDLPLRLVLLLPTTSVVTLVPAGGTLAATDPVWRQLVYAHDVLGTVLVHCYWQTPPDYHGEPLRTPLDWFVLGPAR